MSTNLPPEEEENRRRSGAFVPFEGPAEGDEITQKRPVWLIVLLGILILACLIGGTAIVLPQVLGEQETAVTAEPTQAETEVVQPTEEPTQETGGEATPEATPETTSEPTQEPTTEATPEPTREITPEPTQEATQPPLVNACTSRTFSVCGDGCCNINLENSDICSADCGCKNDGVCGPGEGFGCADCVGPGEAPSSVCGAPCASSSQCAGGLSCAGGVCWDAFICQGIVPEQPYGQLVLPGLFDNDQNNRDGGRTGGLGPIAGLFAGLFGAMLMSIGLIRFARREGDLRIPLGRVGRSVRRAASIVVQIMSGVFRAG
ncbi:MAG: hypothetical protein IT326_01895 [Anaerolineae bacterium]|nr:hypothetical protein [Anaerolineae bacterium]